MDCMKEATRIFAPSSKAEDSDQTMRHVEIVPTMYSIIHSIDSIMHTFKKHIGLTAEEIHTTKIQQLLEMNIFNDVLDCIKKVGHNPNISSKVMEGIIVRVDDVMQESALIDLLEAWSIETTQYIKNQRKDILSQWKKGLINICRGNEEVTKTDIRLGRFAQSKISLFTLPKILLFSYFADKVLVSDINPFEPLDDSKMSEEEEDDANSLFILEDDQTNKDDADVQDDDVCSAPSTASRTDKESVEKPQATKNGRTLPIQNQSKSVVSRTSESVFAMYYGIIGKSDLTAPIEHELTPIKQAWVSTANAINTAEDLKNLWTLH